MFGTLLESRAQRRRRPGGAAISVAVHLSIIATVTATTVHGRMTPPKPPEPVYVHFDKPVAPPVERPQRATSRAVVSSSPTPVVVREIAAPSFVPPSLPPIDFSAGRATDSIVIGSGGAHRGLALAIVDTGEGSGAREWNGVEAQTRILASVKPRYPESLRQAAIDGQVLVRFMVDTTGRVDMASVSVVSSTHDLFTRSVRDALPGFRFKPAEVGGRRVAALAEMPFEFRITR